MNCIIFPSVQLPMIKRYKFSFPPPAKSSAGPRMHLAKSNCRNFRGASKRSWKSKNIPEQNLTPKCSFEWQRAAAKKMSKYLRNEVIEKSEWEEIAGINFYFAISWDIWRRNSPLLLFDIRLRFALEKEQKILKFHVQQLFSFHVFPFSIAALFGLLWLIRKVICKVIKVMSCFSIESRCNVFFFARGLQENNQRLVKTISSCWCHRWTGLQQATTQ